MSEQTTIHIGENSPEHVALRMTGIILWELESKKRSEVSREEFLSTYANCLATVRTAGFSKSQS